MGGERIDVDFEAILEPYLHMTMWQREILAAMPLLDEGGQLTASRPKLWGKSAVLDMVRSEVTEVERVMQREA